MLICRWAKGSTKCKARKIYISHRICGKSAERGSRSRHAARTCMIFGSANGVEDKDESYISNTDPHISPTSMSFAYILLVIFLERHGGYGAPIYPSKGPQEASLTVDKPWSAVLSFITREPQLQRTHSNIVWSCILTAGLCSWTSIHPNVPPQSRRRRLLRGVRTMFWTIVAPELILGWAVRQWFAAKETRDLYNKHRPYGMLKCDPSHHDHALLTTSTFWRSKLDDDTWPFPRHGWFYSC